jgi:hypothetical protein
VIEHHGRSDFADCGCAKALMARSEQNGILVDEISGEMIIDVAEHGVVLDERGHAVGGVRSWKSDIDSVAKDTGIAKEMSRGHA